MSAIDLPKMLREAAHKIESGEMGDVKGMAAVAIGYSGDLEVYMWGDVSPLEASGAMAIAPSLMYGECIIVEGEK